MTVKIHPTADVADEAVIGDGTSLWHQVQVRPGARIGRNCNLGKGVYVDADVHIGDNVKIQNYVSVYHGVTLEDGVFIGPHVCFTNDLRPRAVNPDMTPKGQSDWDVTQTLVRRGAALGANSTIRCGVTIGEWAMVGSGSMVSRDIPAHGLAYGNPARLHGFVCFCAEPLSKESEEAGVVTARCPSCGQSVEILKETWEMAK